ncbi:Pumilio y domain member 6 [Emydomyces testavorans]|uniref:Pumilio y domain member 6 n=1 Tax=Emydomyces testavorans TaxID=2070801 RepID=A0AAF0IMF6_9EURO|nr:Pumilio y domain member 6 [Emydomyces testavorans]
MSGVKRTVEFTQGDARKRSKLKKTQLNATTIGSPQEGTNQLSAQAECSSAPDEFFGVRRLPVENRPTRTSNEVQHSPKQRAGTGGNRSSKGASKDILLKRKYLTHERKLAKPNTYMINRTKKLWERLRLKSHVPRDERKQLVAELYGIITGRVNDFVFKHDAVRVIQTALKYGTPEQRKAIALELKGTYRDLAESKYGKFLLAKLVVHGDPIIRDMIIPEFYGNVRKLMRHSEASWILDDIYRMAATSAQKHMLLREWYGPEFAIFKTSYPLRQTAELSQILEENPEKRTPVMQHLFEFINLLIQKKATGFTILHDAMLQYFLNTKPDSVEATEFLELLKGDDDGNLVKNLAFTKSGSRLMCLALAYSNAKDRKTLLRMYRDSISILSEDVHGHNIILVAYEVIDDTKLTAKLVFPELLGENLTDAERHNILLHRVNHVSHRIPLLYLFGADKLSWLLNDTDQEILEEVCKIRSRTSKKDPAIRRNELISAVSPTMLSFITSSAELLVETSSGCRCITEVLFSAKGDRGPALAAVAATVKSKPETMGTSSVGRMLKSLVQGGRYNPKLQSVQKTHPPLEFHALLYEYIKEDVMSWAVRLNPFVVVALVETTDFQKREELIGILREHKQMLLMLADSPKNMRKEEKEGVQRINSVAARLLLDAM